MSQLYETSITSVGFLIMAVQHSDFASFNRAPASRPATWHKKDSSEWNFPQKTLMVLDILQDPANSARPPIYKKTDLVPVYPVWRQHAWILPRLLPPLIVHRVIMQTTGITFHPVFAVFYYSLSFLIFGVGLFRMLRRMGKTYGFVSENDCVNAESVFKSCFLPRMHSSMALTSGMACPTFMVGRLPCPYWVSLPSDQSLPPLLPTIAISFLVFHGTHPLILQHSVLSSTFGFTFTIV